MNTTIRPNTNYNTALMITTAVRCMSINKEWMLDDAIDPKTGKSFYTAAIRKRAKEVMNTII